ncbi:hypothetical protein ACFV2C_08695 [[Kitasatospora] papulosa]|uniref:hypothetical protein n=1 Tax=[Kitasatospora] papulosa TaxID=1464011 RepID=UPI0036A3603A
MALLELGELGVGSGEFADEPLFEITQPCDAGLTWVGLLASSPCGCSPFLELLLQVAPSLLEGRAKDVRFTGKHLTTSCTISITAGQELAPSQRSGR